jgi:cysteine desulfurase family protein
MIYLDNAATSWPKPESVYTAVDEAMKKAGNPGRSGHEFSAFSSRVIEDTRLLVASLVGAEAPERVVFTLNATDALNTAFYGILKPGDHVITSTVEHNSVSRPLAAIQDAGMELTVVPADIASGVDPADVAAAFRKNTRLVCLTHISNVFGTLNPVAEVGALCRERDVLFLLDASQSAGSVSVSAAELNADLIAFPGHKGLLGPQGTGCLYVREGLELRSYRQGGTGSHSESIRQPREMPFSLESGTPNTPGIAGLGAGIRYVQERGVDEIGRAETALACRLLDGLGRIKGVRVFGPPAGEHRSGVISLRVDGMGTSEVGSILSGSFGIAARAGLQCAGMAHDAAGTAADGGTVRVSIGAFNTEADIDACVRALAEIAAAAAAAVG